MRRLYLDPGEYAQERVTLEGPRARRLLDVLRLPRGAALRAFDGRGHEREATLVVAARGAATLALGPEVEPLPEPPVPVILCCAFPRGARGDWLVEKATEIGVAAFFAAPSERAVLRAGDGRVRRWRRIAIEAAEQCGRAVVPTFLAEPPPAALELVLDLDARVVPGEVRQPLPPLSLVLSRLEAAPLAIALHVGPEGGWSEVERRAHAEAGRLSATLGARTLRAETAAVVALALTLEATRRLA